MRRRPPTAFRFGIPQILQITLLAAVILLLIKLFPVPRSYAAIGALDLLVAAAVWTSRSRKWRGPEDSDVQRAMGRSSMGRKSWAEAQRARRNRLGFTALTAAGFSLISWFRNVFPQVFLHHQTLLWEYGIWLMHLVLAVQICRLDLTPDETPTPKLTFRLTSRPPGSDTRPETDPPR